MSRARRFLLLGMATCVLIVGAVAATALLIPGERVAAAVAARAEAMLGQRVRIDDVRLHFLPLPGVRLSGLTVGGTEDDDPLATARAVELRARLFPLLRGAVIIRSLTLEAPRVLIAVDTAGRTNLPVLEGGIGARTTTPGDARDIVFAIDRLEVSGGRLLFRDHRDGSELSLDGWEQRLRIAGALRAGELGHVDLTGWIGFADVDAALPRVVIPIRDVAAHITHDATLDRAADRIDLRAIGIRLEEISLTGSGAVGSVSSPLSRSLTLALEATGFDAARLFALAPDPVRERLALPDGRPLEPVGTAALQLDVRGPLTPGALPAFDGTLTLDGFGLATDGESLASQIRGEAVFSADSAVLRAAGVLLGETFNAAVALREPADPSAVVAFRGAADLQRLRPLGLIADTLDLTGSIRADVRALIPLGAPGETRMTGSMDLTAIRVSGAEPALELSTGTVTLDGGRVRLDPLMVRIGESADMQVRADVDGWIPALVDSAARPPAIFAEVTADTLDLDALLGPPEGGEYPPLLFARLRDRPLDDGRTAAAAAEDAGLRLPTVPPVEAEMRFRADRVVRAALAYDDIDATIRIHGGTAELLDATFRLMGGTVRAAGSLTSTEHDSAGAPVRARIAATYALTDVGAAPFFDRLTPFRNHLTGDLGMAGSATMDLDRNALPDRGTVGSDGSMTISSGRLANWRVLQALRQRLGLAAQDTVRFRDWTGTFRITGPLVTLEETTLDGADLSARAAGSFDFGGKLDLGATLYLSRELAARAGTLGEQVVAAAGRDGRVPVGLAIRGTAEQPDISLDLSAARETVVARAREAAEEEARELAADAKDAAFDRLQVPDSLRHLPPDSLRQLIGDSLFDLLPDSLRIPGDSLRARTEDAVKSRLRRLFGGG
ncbi:MAG TPA: AsmA family protein [Longimicrobiales bacterium]|nr:AsmA family protein [Longimicrobiales bacterium]